MASCCGTRDGLFRNFHSQWYSSETYAVAAHADHGFFLWIITSYHATNRIESLDHWIAVIILAFLGGRMVRESFKDEDCKKEYDPKSLKVVLALAVATSIDALAIGVSFAFLGMRDFSEILAPISIIGFVSFVMSLIGLLFGIRFGCGIARKLRAELWGGIILIIIGTKILIEHLFFS